MTAVIIPFPRKTPPADSFGEWQRQVQADHPGWDAAKVSRAALLCMAIDIRMERLDAIAGGS